MNAEEESSLPAQLFSENEWRLLWWKTLLLQHSNPDFPNDHRDIEWLAFAAEVSIRHWCLPVIKRFAPLVVIALQSERISGASERIRRMLADFEREMHNPILALDIQDGPWSPSDALEDISLGSPADRPTSADRLLKMASVMISTRLWLDWRQYGEVDWEEGWVRRYGRTRTVPTLWDHVGFANFDLRRSGLPVIQVDDTGRLFVDLGAASAAISNELSDDELRHRVGQVAARHGFFSTDYRSPG